MYTDYAKFENIMAQVADVFATWDENMKDFTNVAREGKCRYQFKQLTTQCLGKDKKSSSPLRSIPLMRHCKRGSPIFEPSVDRMNNCES